eukprot:2670287-Pyramimonas_sp.AAC.1
MNPLIHQFSQLVAVPTMPRETTYTPAHRDNIPDSSRARPAPVPHNHVHRAPYEKNTSDWRRNKRG